MPPILVHSLLAYILAPVITHFSMKVVLKFRLARGPKLWTAVAATGYAVVAIMIGMTQGVAAGNVVAANLALSDIAAWAVGILGGALSVGLCFFVIVRLYAQFRDMVGDEDSPSM